MDQPPPRLKISFALDETRMLIIGAEVILGFQYQSILQDHFLELPKWSQYLQLTALLLMIFTLIMLIAPSMHHQITFDGKRRKSVVSYITFCIQLALLPFIISLGIEIFRAANTLTAPAMAAIPAAFIVVLAAVMWYAVPWLTRLNITPSTETSAMALPTVEPTPEPDLPEEEHTPMEARLKYVMTEARVVLPGAQALLGFQFVGFFMDSFQTLPRTSQWIHLASLLSIGVCIIMLIAPATFHRIAEHGQVTKRAYRFANNMVIFAGIPLALGLAGDLYIVTLRTTDSLAIALTCLMGTLLLTAILWYIHPWCQKQANGEA
jgi:hypothetical protein